MYYDTILATTKKMLKTLKVRLYPNTEQEALLAQSFGNLRWFWNYSLNLCETTYKETGKVLTRNQIQSLLPELKKDEDTKWLKETYSQCLQVVALNLSVAYKNFFEGRARKPRFKSKHGKQSISYPQNVKLKEGNYLKIPKIGLVKAKITKKINHKLRTITISKDCTNKYYACVLYDNGLDYPETCTEGKAIGLDVGLANYLITSDGDKVDNPKWFNKHEHNLKVKQQKLCRKKKGSKNRTKAKLKVAKLHQRITNSREDFLHKLSRKIVDENQIICVENLNIRGMIKNHKLSKAIHQVGWGMFLTMLSYKAKELGKVYQEIDRFFPSSKTCSNCGHKIESMPLDIRSWKCHSCGAQHDRDVNAAKNIMMEGLRILGLEHPVSLSPECKTEPVLTVV